MRSATRWFKQVVIVVAVLGLLTSAWPSVAQSNETPTQFLEQRLRDPLVYANRGPATPGIVGASQYQPTDEDGHDWTKIAVASYRDNNWEIYAAEINSLATRRTTNSAVDFTPDLNRGCTRITFVSTRNGNYEVYVMNFDGSGQTRLTNTTTNEYSPRWSPDGLKIAFYSLRDGNAEIYVMNADGSNQVRITNNPAWDGHPAWSPDGSKIVFASNRSGNYDLWTMNADGTNVHQLTFGETDAAYPDWAPDGSRIVFNNDANPPDGFFDVAIVSANGGAVQYIGGRDYALDWLGPKWHSTGRFIALSNIHWVNINSQWYWDAAYASARSPDNFYTGSSTWGGLDSAPYNWWPSWQSTDIVDPSSTVSNLARWSLNEFSVSWSASSDLGTPASGFKSFDIQYRDGASGAWTDWLTDTLRTSGFFTGQDGHTYYFRSRARDYANNLEAYPGGSGDASTTIDATAPTSIASAPAIVTSPQFLVTLNGTDATSGIASYDIQYRDGTLGTWTDWVTATTQTALQFNGQLGHTYYFQSRARDKAGNLEAYPDGDGNTHTVTPLYALNGAVKGNRDQAVALASVQTIPAALNQPKTDHQGNFALYYNLSGTVSLTATRSTFGLLPFMPNLIVSDTSSSPIVYLPPLDDQLSDSHFESGGLSIWNPTGDLTPTITSTAHTGDYAVLLGGIVPSDTISSGPYLSAIEQTITMPMTLTDGTLSLLYEVTAADPLSDTLTAYLVGSTDTLTFTLPVTATAWTHRWFDVSAWASPTATLRIELSTPGKEREVGVLVDEVTWGSSVIGSRPIYLPVIRR